MPLRFPGYDIFPSAACSGYLVACFCAAWCDTCQEYQSRFAALSDTLPEHTFYWIDIEGHPELLGDEDIENFPTLLVQLHGKTVFFGPMLPHIAHLERLLASVDQHSPSVPTTLPDLQSLLKKAV